MIRLTKQQKKEIVSGFAFTWAGVLMFSLITNAVVGIASTIINSVSSLSNSGQSNNGYFASSQRLYMSVSKYPSQTRLKLGLPWM